MILKERRNWDTFSLCTEKYYSMTTDQSFWRVAMYSWEDKTTHNTCNSNKSIQTRSANVPLAMSSNSNDPRNTDTK